ncbi:hypothetical protein [Paraliobacillus sp. X-1268]|uniref:hypothetical protein n=1 Tax=Paraliobacillus sp. X-1268 TaxID=2213193 RepID=UPI000E3DB7B1|nr:hypothetical protein [Paraliobacillus sp. X-1268]
MFDFFIIIATFLLPIFAIVFCLNLVAILKKVKEEEFTNGNTILLTLSFTAIVYTFSMLIIQTSS